MEVLRVMHNVKRKYKKLKIKKRKLVNEFHNQQMYDAAVSLSGDDFLAKKMLEHDKPNDKSGKNEATKKEFYKTGASARPQLSKPLLIIGNDSDDGH